MRLMVNALKKGLIPYFAHSAAQRKKTVIEDGRLCCHFTLKATSIPG